jgi:hypothetical protein
MALFSKRRPQVDYSQYKPDPLQYIEDYTIIHGQPDRVLRELRTIKILMAILIPLFAVFAFLHVLASCLTGFILASILFYSFAKKKSIKQAVASLTSIGMGIIFGVWFRHLIKAAV